MTDIGRGRLGAVWSKAASKIEVIKQLALRWWKLPTAHAAEDASEAPSSTETERPPEAPDAVEDVAWRRLLHLGAHADVSGRPSIEELGIADVHRVCDRAWKYSRADIMDPDWFAERKTSQWRETCALAGSAAESLMLSSAAYVEAEWHKKVIADDPDYEGMAVAQRYLADTAIDTAIAVGHRLINLVARVARTDPETSESFGKIRRFALLGPSYVPFATDDEDAWLSLNARNLAALQSTIPRVHARSLEALDELLSSSAWQTAWDIRGENFHRWRKEHESVSGVDAQSGNIVDLYKETTGEFYGRVHRARGVRHTISDGKTEDTTAAAGEIIKAVATTLDVIITDTTAALKELTGITLEIADGRTRQEWSTPLTRRPSAPAEQENQETPPTAEGVHSTTSAGETSGLPKEPKEMREDGADDDS
ncbi:hypothetical protein PWF70_23875 (plasmid) [Gordonia sp. Swx-4]|uniref:hypothetical protein n=1 Tax=Gordonia sp. Swx-4 TaxID=3029399 RepID=UPI00257378BB|nr:hypothetical protein [Gordonia sp. Swx-4]WJG15900.1 hypothetical protein PWF70_23875 [Gordonia sp. Swx-4]